MENVYKPILFSTPMVLANIDGRKTQTRRTNGLEKINVSPESWQYCGFSIKGDIKKGIDPNIYYVFRNITTNSRLEIRGKYKTGNILWVRERFTEWPEGEFQYFASTAMGDELGIWKPSIHMPKKASRLFLKVKSVKVEQLRDIFHSDARAEGVDFIVRPNPTRTVFYNYLTKVYDSNELYSFMTLWQSINGEDSWAFNPWVWVIEYERIEKPLDFIV
ncbi:hypothetical protein GJU43_15030 [Flavobacterium sp. LC2016-23]|uniref:hypothetical protein n=1 Tax=Flavobacterium sp. LC2016-23 TaxID=2666330 RepID=UPI0012AEF589|nr:hypothetical protein [Flavobacterium sp. LC2016-23]MRX40599.1 hypothetical protein [Flavobacterium sp. LC2016-23]